METNIYLSIHPFYSGESTPVTQYKIIDDIENTLFIGTKDECENCLNIIKQNNNY